MAAISEGIAPIKHGNVVEAEESTLKHVVAGAIVAVGPPAVFQDQLAQGRAQEEQIRLFAGLAIDLEDAHGCPGPDGGVGVGQGPLVGGGLGVGGRVVRGAQQHALLLRCGRIEHRKGHGVEHQVPLAEVGILPGIGHRDHIMGMQPLPLGVLREPALMRWRRCGGIPRQPALHTPAVILLAPQQPCGPRAVQQPIILGEVGHA